MKWLQAFRRIMWEWITPCWGPVQTVSSRKLIFTLLCPHFTPLILKTGLQKSSVRLFVYSNSYSLLEWQKKRSHNGAENRKHNFRWSEFTSEQGLWCLLNQTKSMSEIREQWWCFSKMHTLWTHTMLYNTHNLLLAHTWSHAQLASVFGFEATFYNKHLHSRFS